VAIVLTGVISDKIMKGRCYLLIIIMCALTVLYDALMAIFPPSEGVSVK
jgi:hypothetical protein